MNKIKKQLKRFWVCNQQYTLPIGTNVILLDASQQGERLTEGVHGVVLDNLPSYEKPIMVKWSDGQITAVRHGDVAILKDTHHG